MLEDKSAGGLRLARKVEQIPIQNPGSFSSGVEIECNLHEIEHPEGRFRRLDGTRYDVCVLEMMIDPTFRPPGISRASFVGDSADTRSAAIRLGNVRLSSFRLYLISPGEAFGPRWTNGKAPGVSTTQS